MIPTLEQVNKNVKKKTPVDARQFVITTSKICEKSCLRNGSLPNIEFGPIVRINRPHLFDCPKN